MKISISKRRLFTGISFISPWIIGFICFILYPLGASLYYSFTDFSLFSKPEWIGFTNYFRLFSDPKFLVSLKNTIIFSAMIVPTSILTAMFLAILLNAKIKARGLIRGIIFLPSIVPQIAIAVIWIWILNPKWGLLNSVFRLIGLPGAPWLSSPDWVKWALLITTLWMIGTDMVLYLAALQNIPNSYYEAAELDGANFFQKTLRITIPLVTPVTFFHLVNALIWSFQYFNIPYLMGGQGAGKPADSMLFYSIYLYQNGFRYLKMGYASAMAWILFIILMIATLIILKTSKGWVHYGVR